VALMVKQLMSGVIFASLLGVITLLLIALGG
jgi:hypothetical protein